MIKSQSVGTFNRDPTVKTRWLLGRRCSFVFRLVRKTIRIHVTMFQHVPPCAVASIRLFLFSNTRTFKTLTFGFLFGCWFIEKKKTKQWYQTESLTLNHFSYAMIYSYNALLYVSSNNSAPLRAMASRRGAQRHVLGKHVLEKKNCLEIN